MDKVYLTYQKNSNNIISFDGSQQTGPLLEGLTHTYNSLGFFSTDFIHLHCQTNYAKYVK